MTQWDGTIDIHDTEWFETHEEIPRAAAAAPLSMTHFTTVAIFAASWIHQLIYGASTLKQPCDWNALRKFFAWKPAFFTDIDPMRDKAPFPRALLDFVREHGALQGLFSDNAMEQLSDQVQKILRQCNIFDIQLEPYQQNQNPAEHRIQTVKAMTTTTMDRTGALKKLWLLCLLYCVYVLNRLAHATFNDRTPIEACFGFTPAISAFFCFHFFKKVYYHERNESYASFKILTDDQDFTLLDRSVVCPVDDDNPNLRAPSTSEEELIDKNIDEYEPILHSLAEGAGNEESEEQNIPFNVENIKLPTVDPLTIIGRTFLVALNDEGETLRAQVKRFLPTEEDDPIDEETGAIKKEYLGKSLVAVQVGDAEEFMTYNAVLDNIERQVQRELNQTPEERVWRFKDIVSHRKNKMKHEMLVKWEDDQKTWEPLKNIAMDDPVTCARYAMANNLLDVPGWKRFRRYAKMKTKIMNQLVQQNKAVLLGELLYVGKDPKLYYDRLAKVHGFQLNGVGEPKYHLGGDFLRPTKPMRMLTWGSRTYINCMHPFCSDVRVPSFTEYEGECQLVP